MHGIFDMWAVCRWWTFVNEIFIECSRAQSHRHLRDCEMPVLAEIDLFSTLPMCLYRISIYIFRTDAVTHILGTTHM